MIDFPQDEEPDHFYLAGPMSGHPEHNFPEFRRYTKRLREIGYKILSPAEMTEMDDQPAGSRPWEWYLRQDMFMMLQCKGIILMPGWKTSRGARAECDLADTLAMEVFTIDDQMRVTPSFEFGMGRVRATRRKART